MRRSDSKRTGKRNLHDQSCSGFICTFYVKEDLYKRVLERGVFLSPPGFPFLRGFGRQLNKQGFAWCSCWRWCRAGRAVGAARAWSNP